MRPDEIALAQTEVEIWNRLASAANDVTDPLRLVTLATVGTTGRPSARLMVLHGVDREHRRLWFYTDRVSHKLAELARRPFASIVAYDSTMGAQIRLDGVVIVHVDDEVADNHWQQLAVLLKFTDTNDAHDRTMRHQPDPKVWTLRGQSKKGELQAGRDSFAVIEMRVETIDWYAQTDAGPRHVRFAPSQSI